jgi:RNA polymerase sigma-70 factor (ECF subfamily)
MTTAGTPAHTTRASFDDFFSAELPSLEAVAFGLTGRRSLAEELAQEAMLVVYRRWDALAAYDDPAAFARRVVVNKSVSTFRRLIAEARALNRVRSRPAPAGLSWGPPDEELWAAVRRLPARQAQAVALRYVADLDSTQIGAVLGCEPGAVRVLLHRARRSLAAALEHEDQEALDER